MSTCRSCGQKIHWIELTSGKKMPCDPELISDLEAEEGDVLVNEEGETFKVRRDSKMSFTGYVSHFSTCPDAEKWRKPRVSTK